MAWDKTYFTCCAQPGRTRKSVIALCAAQALLGVASAAVGMFFAPAALGAIETARRLRAC